MATAVFEPGAGGPGSAWIRCDSATTFEVVPAKPGLIIQLVNWTAQRENAGTASTIQWSAGGVALTPIWRLTDTTEFFIAPAGVGGHLFEGKRGQAINVTIGGNVPVNVKCLFTTAS